MTTEKNTYIEVARTRGAWGVRGWVHVVALGSGDALFEADTWLFKDRAGTERLLHVTDVRDHGTGIVAKFEEITNKEEADALHGTYWVAREDFPDLEEDEHWAVDMIGCTVVNLEGETVGVARDLTSNGVQDILVVENTEMRQTYAIPVVPLYVQKIDTDSRQITVDWHKDWV